MPKRLFAVTAAAAGPRKKFGYNQKKKKNMVVSIPKSLQGFVRTSAAFRRSMPGRPELKYFDTALEFFINRDNLAAVSNVTGLLNVSLAQGTGESQRVGRLVRVKSIQLRGTVTYQPGAATTTPLKFSTYVWIVLDKQANGAAPLSTDIFTTVDAAGDMINLDNSSRFKILAKKTIEFHSAGDIVVTQSRKLEHYMRCDIPIDYSSTTGAITEVRSNNILLCYGQSPTYNPIIDLTATSVIATARLRYYDT